MNWIRVPNGGKIDIDAFKHMTKAQIDKAFPYYTNEQREFIFNECKPVQTKDNRNKSKPDIVD